MAVSVEKSQSTPRGDTGVAEGKSKARVPIALVAVALVAVVLFALFQEPLVWQKIVKELVMPTGICWLLLSVSLLSALTSRDRWRSGVLGLAWLLLTVLGSTFVGDLLIGSLENRFLDQRPLQMDRFDILIVLGGGTASTETGRSQLGKSGDRVAVAAQMYHANKVEKIIVTGHNIVEFAGDISTPADQAYDVLASLGVDKARIEKAGGRNTLEEMRNLATLLPKGKRIGLVTSAWHLPRALRRAKAAGLDLVPVPADFWRGPTPKASILRHLPRYEGLKHSTLAIHEYLGMAVGR